MNCPVCKGKKGKNVTKKRSLTAIWDYRYPLMFRKVKVFKPCKNCNGTGEVATDVSVR